MHAWLHRIDQHFPVRYLAWLLSGIGLLLSAFSWVAFDVGGLLALACLFLVAIRPCEVHVGHAVGPDPFVLVALLRGQQA